MKATIDLLDLGDELLWEPDRAVPPDAWAGHVPFAFWLIKILKPQIFVELGTHSGNSYSAFCQGISQTGLTTRAYAVDTWKGDEHSGSYSDDVYRDLHAFNTTRFGEFSTLLRETFDEARAYFANGSVDLLHIDGMHSYEAVRHDFDSWKSTISRRGVVLFHDTNVRERDFGVWKLWRELAEEYPSFEFLHSNGLGILGLGGDQSPALRRLFEAGNTESAEVRRIFSVRGDAIRTRIQLSESKSNFLGLSHETERLKLELQESQQKLSNSGEKVVDLSSSLDQQRIVVGKLRTAVESAALASASAASKAAELESKHRNAMHSLLDKQEEAVRQARNDERARTDASYLRSTSWRVTAPLRLATVLLRRALARSRTGHFDLSRPSRARRNASSRNARSSLSLESKSIARSALAARLRLFLDSPATLKFAVSEAPDISIILILFNQAELTYACLTSIQESLRESSLRIEVIILDNGSSDQTPELLKRVSGAKIISSPVNLHFLLGVNKASAEADGNFILLLNNDAQLLPGSLDAAHRVFAEDLNVGAVGGRIILPDGTLQEAGSIIWKDGTCEGYGRNRAPSDPEFMFRREVDYCSGAFLLTPRSLFDRLGGLDERYQPAYYEETDYCVRLWESGYRVVFDPDVVILHHEFGSGSSDSAIELQKRNGTIFRERHAHWLSGQRSSVEDNAIKGRSSRTSAKRILMIDDRVPHPNLGSGYPRANDIIRSLVKTGAQVTFFPMHEHRETWPEVRRTIPSTVEVMLGHSERDLVSFMRDRSEYYQGILICRPHNMAAFRNATKDIKECIGNATIIYDAEAIFARREIIKRQFFGKPIPPTEADELIDKEIALTNVADLVVSVSRAESKVFLEHGVSDVEIVGHALSISPTEKRFDERTDIIFVGAVTDEESPNADSLRWFANQILPRIRSHLGFDIRLKVVGVCNAASIRAMDGLTLDLMGKVDDLTPYFENARIMVAPTRYAAGIPHKVAQSAALGVPVVATELIAEQLAWTAGHDLLAAASPAEFADECIRLYTDEKLWSRVREAALAQCSEDCSSDAFDAAVLRVTEIIPAPAFTTHAINGRTGTFSEWILENDLVTRDDRDLITSHIASFAQRPLISVVVPLYNTPEVFLRRCIDSVRAQIYQNWELCLSDDASPLEHVSRICLEYAAHDPRIRFTRRSANGHIAAATNSALDLANGDFVAFVDHDDELAPHALYMVVDAINQDPTLDLIFSDEDKIDEDGRRFEPWFKSDWNYDLMLSQNAVVHLAVYRHSILREIGGIRLGFDGSQDYDLVLRFMERTVPERIKHIPFVLYHWRAIPGSVALAVDEKTYAYEAAARAIQEHLDRIGSGATVSRESHSGYYRVHWPLPESPPCVTIIIPTKDKVDLLKIAIDSIVKKTAYTNYEILVVDNNSEKRESRVYFEEVNALKNIKVVSYNKPYNFAALNNWAVDLVSSPLVAFVNNDIEIIDEEWLSEMVSQAIRPGVGAVGAKLLYPNGTIQHAGVVIGIGATAGHPHSGLPRDALGYFGRAATIQQFSAVTGACLVMKREVFVQVGGFDAVDFAIAYNDVDLGLRLCKAGYSVVWTPYAVLYHHESASLGSPDSPERKERFAKERGNLQARWPDAIRNDRFYNPNLTVNGGDFSLAFPSRVIRPWLAASRSRHG